MWQAYNSHGVELRADVDAPEFSNSIYDAAIKHLHSKKGFTIEMLSDEPVANLMGETRRILNLGFNKGIEGKISDKMRSALSNDISLFSGFKTINEMEEAKGLLFNNEGKIKPFDTFLRDAQLINDKYNKDYLKAEYNVSIASAQMAEKWESYEEDDLLQYRTAGDSKVREAHVILNGITLLKSDSFWDSYYPPNGWGCRCSIVAVSKRRYSQSNSEEAAKLGEASFADQSAGAKIFLFNPGKSEKIFPAKHPYYKVAKISDVKEIINNE